MLVGIKTSIHIISVLIFTWKLSKPHYCGMEGQSNGGNVSIGFVGNREFANVTFLKLEESDCSCILMDSNDNEKYQVVEKVKRMQNKGIENIFIGSSDSYTNKIISHLKINCSHAVLMQCLQHCTDNQQLSKRNSMVDRQCISVSMTKNHKDINFVTKMAASVFPKLHWSFAIVFYDSQTAHIYELYQNEINKAGYQHISYNMENSITSHALRKILDGMYDRFVGELINVTIICSLLNTQLLLNEASLYDTRPENFRRKALRDHSSWFVVAQSDDIERDIAEHATMLDNVVILNLLSTRTKVANKTMSCSEIGENKNKCLEYSIHTLMWKKGRTAQLIRKFDEVGYVELNGKLHLHSELQPNFKFGFNGRLWNVSTIRYPPFTEMIWENGTITSYVGFSIDMLNEFAKTLNFTYTLTYSDKFGLLEESGKWNGMVGQLERRDVDLVVGALTIRPDRETVMDFSLPYYYDTSTLLMKKPDPNEKKLYTFTKPLRWEVLLCVGIALPVSALLLCMIEKFTPYYKTHGNVGKQDCQMSFWYLFGSLISQGGESLPNSQSGRTVVSAFWLFAIVMVATYCGNLIAFLTVPLEKPPFNSLEEMIAQSEYKWGTIGGSFFVTWFKESPVEPLRSVWAGIQRFNETDPDVLNPEPLVHVAKMDKEKYVYFGDKVFMDQIKSNRCELRTVDEEIPNNFFGVGLPNNSLYTKIFSDQIIKFQEKGILQTFKYNHWPRQDICPSSLTPTQQEVELIDIYSAFYLIAGGVTIATIVLVSEKIVKCMSVKCVKENDTITCEHIRTVSNSHTDSCLYDNFHNSGASGISQGNIKETELCNLKQIKILESKCLY